MEWIEHIANWLDSRFLIPGTNIRFGIDPIMSLFPIIGDLMTYVVSAMLIYTMYNKGASRKVVIKMILNSTLDAIIGAIPLVGTVFDIFTGPMIAMSNFSRNIILKASIRDQARDF
jgi:hypothetical protein